MNLPNIELVAAKVHEAWMAQKAAAGVTSRRLDTTGEELLVPYEQLSDPAKELDRASVRAVYEAIGSLSAPPLTGPSGPSGPIHGHSV